MARERVEISPVPRIPHINATVQTSRYENLHVILLHRSHEIVGMPQHLHDTSVMLQLLTHLPVMLSPNYHPIHVVVVHDHRAVHRARHHPVELAVEAHPTPQLHTVDAHFHAAVHLGVLTLVVVPTQHAVRLRVRQAHTAVTSTRHAQRRLSLTRTAESYRGMTVHGHHTTLVPVVSMPYYAHVRPLVGLKGIDQLVGLQLPQLHGVVQRCRDEQLPRWVHRRAADEVCVPAQHLGLTSLAQPYRQLNSLRQAPAPHAEVVARDKQHVVLCLTAAPYTHLVVPAQPLRLLGAL